MFNFLNALKSHKKVEDRFDALFSKAQQIKYQNISQGTSTEIGSWFSKRGSIKISDSISSSTGYIASDMFEIEHKQAIEKCRYISTLPEVDDAVEEVVNEALVMNENDVDIVNIDFKDSDLLPLEIRSQIIDEFQYIRDVLLDFKNEGHRMFRQFYIDGVLYLEKVFDSDNTRLGIQAINWLDSRYVSYYSVFRDNPFTLGGTRTLTDEFFVVRKPRYVNRFYRTEAMYATPSQSYEVDSFSVIKVPKELITYVDSGIYHIARQYPMSYLSKALKVANQLTMLEDALLVYRITRAPERRVFYIEVGNMPVNAAEAHIQDLIRTYRQEKVYDVPTGTIKDRNAVYSMTEDFWLPRRNGTTSTEVTTLAGGQNLDQVADLDYFARKIWRALNVPYSRRADKENSGTQYNSGRELSLDELKFYKFILKLRRQFSRLFDDLLATQLILKKIVGPEDINEVLGKIKYVYNNDNYFNEFLKLEVLNAKIDSLSSIDGFVGKYVSQNYVWENILEFSEEEKRQIIKEMEREKKGDFLGDGTSASTEETSEEEAPAGEENPKLPEIG